MIFGAKTLACLIGAASAILLTSTAAQAESFSGPYIGLEAGYAVTDVDGVTIAGPFERTEHSAVLAGIAGYRIPVGPDGPVVVGAEASAGSYTRRADMRYGLAGSVGLRLFESGLVYGKAGYAWLEDVEANAGKGLHGLVLGGGYEHALAGNFSLRAEYRHVDWKGGPRLPDNTTRFKGQEIAAAVIYGF